MSGPKWIVNLSALIAIIDPHVAVWSAMMLRCLVFL